MVLFVQTHLSATILALVIRVDLLLNGMGEQTIFTKGNL